MNKAISLALPSETDEGADEGLSGQVTMHLVWDVYKESQICEVVRRQACCWCLPRPWPCLCAPCGERCQCLR